MNRCVRIYDHDSESLSICQLHAPEKRSSYLKHMHARCRGNVSQLSLFFLKPEALFQLGTIFCETDKLRVSQVAPFCDLGTLNKNISLQNNFF